MWKISLVTENGTTYYHPELIQCQLVGKCKSNGQVFHRFAIGGNIETFVHVGDGSPSEPEYYKKWDSSVILWPVAQRVRHEQMIPKNMFPVWFAILIVSDIDIDIKIFREIIKRLGELADKVFPYYAAKRQSFIIRILCLLNQIDPLTTLNTKMEWKFKCEKMSVAPKAILPFINMLIVCQASDEEWNSYKWIEITRHAHEARTVINNALSRLLSHDPNAFVSTGILSSFNEILSQMLHFELTSICFSSRNQHMRKIYVETVNRMKKEDAAGAFENYWTMVGFDFAECDRVFDSCFTSCMSVQEVSRMASFYEDYVVDVINMRVPPPTEMGWFTTQLLVKIVEDHLSSFMMRIPQNHDTRLITEHFVYKVFSICKFRDVLRDNKQFQNARDFIAAYDKFIINCQSLKENDIERMREAVTAYSMEDIREFNGHFDKAAGGKHRVRK